MSVTIPINTVENHDVQEVRSPKLATWVGSLDDRMGRMD